MLRARNKVPQGKQQCNLFCQFNRQNFKSVLGRKMAFAAIATLLPYRLLTSSANNGGQWISLFQHEEKNLLTPLNY